MRFIALVLSCTAVVLSMVSCGSGAPSYQDRVRPLADSQMHPKVSELLPLLEKPGEWQSDDLVRTWKDYTADETFPLRKKDQVTFVYYDYSHRLENVYLEASFASGRLEPLHRQGQTALWLGVYRVPNLDGLSFRFSDGARPLVDAFQPDVDNPTDLWHRKIDPTQPRIDVVSGLTTKGLMGVDLEILLPRNYDENQGLSYPLILNVGIDLPTWPTVWTPLVTGSRLPDSLTVMVRPSSAHWTPASLKTILEDQVLPWLHLHYRISVLPADLHLAAWGEAVPATKEMTVGRNDTWPQVWLAPTVPGTDPAPAHLVSAYLTAAFHQETP